MFATSTKASCPTGLMRYAAVVLALTACANGGGSGASGAGGSLQAGGNDAADTSGGAAGSTSDALAASPDAESGADPDAAIATCDPGPALAVCAGCHGPQRAEGGLNLAPDGLAGRLVGVPSTRCPGELLVDPDDPERSMLLTVLDPERHAAAGFGTPGHCAVSVMPPGTMGLPDEAATCVSAWVNSVASAAAPPPPPPVEPLGIDSALAKVKTLLTGGAPTADERARIAADRSALRVLTAAWVETPEFEAKLLAFLRTALHQDLVGTLDEQLDKPRGLNARIRRLQSNVGDAFARTAARIVRDRQPFTSIATTRDWELTTALAIALAYADQDANARNVQHTITRTAPANAPDPVTVRYMVANRTWVEPSIPANCQFQARQPAERVLDLFMGLVRCGGDTQDHRFENPLLLETDFSDWRTVALVNSNADRPATPFYDLPALRSADALPLRIRRAGFFTSLAFLANYPTNTDNLFRVTTNQALIVALQSTFNAADPTEHFPSPALDDAHAAPGTSCHGCHRLLDPMRVGLWDAFSPVYQRAEEQTEYEGRFAFEGHRVADPVDSIVAFGQALATHPRFKTAWVQRLCYWANTQACNEADPAFQQIADAFEAGGFDFKAMLVDLFSSPLITGAEVVGDQGLEPVVSITRANHLCPLIEVRMELPGLCSELGSSLGLIPKDEFARGETVPALTAAPSTFFYAAAEAMCTRLSSRLVGDAASGRRLSTDDAPAALAALVERFMGLNPDHPRHGVARAALQEHFDAVRAQPGASVSTALRSTVMVACLSPDVMGLGL